ncbi:hypothetical protein [Vitiosangium sp. GDMCC 1.1324]|uniref:hypothetical protein n=1 Tax=Vitiosangium sp. (strain GDMCC 1.1324) TaxID=2138576 RepID=UPI001E553DDD|nr:hypothetical protein [Vitiosangium sp. GDMCC 1.1324]
MSTTNGMSPNGLSTNGLSTNGLSTNGLSTNGLTTLALSTTKFKTWFDSNAPEYSNMVMSYVVACAYPAGRSLTYTSSTGTTYTWNGGLGLTPDWASGKRISSLEQQLLSACLAAHVNKFGLHVMISVRGWNARGTALPVDATETTTFTEPEAAFFGNLFTGDGAFACNDRTNTTPAESSARACGLSSQASGTSVECPPLVHIGNCATNCTLDRSTGLYTSCTYGGKTYKPLTTKLRPADIYRCGDGVCQVSESCDTSKNGNGTRYNSCASDCGICP